MEMYTKMQVFPKERKQIHLQYEGLQMYTCTTKESHYEISKAFITNTETRSAFKL